jgi:hypothetical protein
MPERFGRTHGAASGPSQRLHQLEAARSTRLSVSDLIRFGVVAMYLAAVMVWLLLSRQIRPNFSIRQSLRAFLFRQREFVPLQGLVHDEGYCYHASIDPRLPSDRERVSRVQVYENGVPLPRVHAPLDLIRQRGHGAFSHRDGTIYFSTSDNSDPRINGRRYTFKEI